MSDFLFLSQEEIIAAGGLDFPAAIEDLITAYSMLDQGAALNPVGPSMDVGDKSHSRFVSIHAGWLGGDLDIAGVKIVTRAPRNPFERKLPGIIAAITLVDPHTGLPEAVLDGTLITAVRTGASTAVGAKYLAPPDASIVAVIGAGVMAKAQVFALHAVFKLEEIRVFDLATARADRFAKEISGEVGLAVRIASSAREAIVGADIVAPATTVSLADAYIEPDWIAKGAFLANVSDNDYRFETVLSADRIVIDGPKQFAAPVTMGELKRKGLLEDRVVTIGQIINGKEHGRTSRDQICFFSAMGLGVHDIMCARRIVTSAKAMGLGHHLRLWEAPKWV